MRLIPYRMMTSSGLHLLQSHEIQQWLARLTLKSGSLTDVDMCVTEVERNPAELDVVKLVFPETTWYAWQARESGNRIQMFSGCVLGLAAAQWI